jgi:hypothetical protein
MNPRWNAFAAACRNEFSACPFAVELVAACHGHEDIAWAVYFHLRDDSLAWLAGRVPALDGSAPASLLSTGQADVVRDCLWSMPC